MHQKPKVLSKNPLAKTKLFQIEQVKLEFSNNAQRTYECLRSNGIGAVTILAIENNDILLIREYGCAIDEYCLTLPKGAMIAGETPLIAANRELQEEVGFGARSLQLMTQLYSAPSYTSNPLYYVLAQDCFASRLPGDEPEELELVRWPINKWRDLLHEPAVKDTGTTLSLLLWAQNYA